MATQALYRKWRSRAFEEVIGQDHVTRTLQNALATGRVAHAYLFTGPRGTGKTTTARLLAKAVNCVGEGDSKPCGECTICRAVDEGRLLDMVEIDAASNRGIDEIRDLREKVGFRPGEARIKFYIIDEVHMLTDPAFNALLKTLEEPPAHVIFVLATTEPHKIPATIISRCQRFDFRRIPLAQITRWLGHISEMEEFEVEPAALDYIGRQAGGSMRDAISLLDQLTAYGSQTITLAQVQAVLGAVASQAVMELADSLIGGDLASGLDTIGRVVGDGAEPRQFTREFVEYLRGLLLLKMGDGQSLLRSSVPDETLVRMEEQASLLSPRTLLRATRLFNAAALEMKVGFLPQLPLELAFVETLIDESSSEATPTVSNSQTQRHPAHQAASSKPASSAHPAPSPSPSLTEPASEAKDSPSESSTTSPSPSPKGDLSFEVVEGNWQAILDQLHQANRMTAALMRSPGVAPAGVEGNNVVVEVPSEWPDELKRRIEKPNHRALIEQCIGQVLGGSVGLRFVVQGEYGPGTPPGATASNPPPSGETGQVESSAPLGEASGTVDSADQEASEEDPMLQEALSLGAEIKNVD
jgi:DNA polymerase-3 subunit gamma/tau